MFANEKMPCRDFEMVRDGIRNLRSRWRLDRITQIRFLLSHLIVIGWKRSDFDTRGSFEQLIQEDPYRGDVAYALWTLLDHPCYFDAYEPVLSEEKRVNMCLIAVRTNNIVLLARMVKNIKSERSRQRIFDEMKRDRTWPAEKIDRLEAHVNKSILAQNIVQKPITYSPPL